MTGIRTAGRVAVIGDVGGHVDELRRELVRLGAHPDSGRLPEDLTVIQVGDLIHRGPDSEGVVSLVDGYLRRQPEQWVQLVGNHEAQYLRKPAFEWPEHLHDRAVDTLRDWWATGRMRMAVAVATPTESFLITHAGLTVGFWRAVLDAPARADQAAAALNSLIGDHDPVLFRPGHLLTAGPPEDLAGPIWAAAATELVPGWLQAGDLPFSQIHGHSSVYDWHRRIGRGPAAVAALAEVDDVARHEVLSLPGGRIIGIDPGHGRRAVRHWRSFEIDGGPPS